MLDEKPQATAMMDREISERLTEALKTRAVGLAGKLQPTLDLANRQLEWMCPAFMGMGRSGFVAGLAVTVKRGAWVIVLANQEKVFTLQILEPPEGLSRGAFLDHCVDGVGERLGRRLTAEELLFVINDTVTQHGGPPAGETPAVGQIVCMQILGLLFAPMPREERAEMAAEIDQLIAANICPLHVGLVGPGAKKETLCGVWPLGLPFAPYLDHLDALAR